MKGIFPGEYIPLGFDKKSKKQEGAVEFHSRLQNANILPELVAFGIGLGTVWYQHWQVADLVWSLWLGSLVVGYFSIFATIAGGLFAARKLAEGSPENKSLILAVATGIGLFLLGFFSLHFCAFHAVHAGFLTEFFPLDGVPAKVFFAGFMNPFALWTAAFQFVFPEYWVFLIALLIAEHRHLFAAFNHSHGLSHTLNRIQSPGKMAGNDGNPARPRALRNVFSRPYINVIRMHLLIFFFAGAAVVGLQSFWVIAVVYLVYFFPWRLFRSDKPAVAVS